MNLNYKFDENLKEVPESKTDYQLAISQMRTTVQSVKDINVKVSNLGQLGVYCRISGNLQSAELYLHEAIKLISQHKLPESSDVTMRAKLGHVYQYQLHYEKAHKILDELIKRCKLKKELASILDIPLYHSGLCYFDEKKYAEALALFEESLQLRKAKGEKNTIALTEIAILKTKHKLGNVK